MSLAGNADYIKARLRRDHPEIAEQLEQGEHRSARRGHSTQQPLGHRGHFVQVRQNEMARVPVNRLPKTPVLATTQLGHAVLALLQHEARSENLQVDDDCPRVPSPLDSAQRRRFMKAESNNA